VCVRPFLCACARAWLQGILTVIAERSESKTEDSEKVSREDGGMRCRGCVAHAATNRGAQIGG
jgi:hypothetical protein